MNEIAIFARTFEADSLEGVLDAVVSHGIGAVHFNFSCAGVGAMPESISAALCEQIRGAMQRRTLSVVGVSGTFNAIHPDAAKRAADTRRAIGVIEATPKVGASLMSLCTGSRDAGNMWKAHSGNNAAEAWHDLVRTLSQLLPAAESAGVTLGVEPERGNVINTAAKARRLLEEMKSPRLKIIMDGANLFDAGDTANMRETLTEAFDLLAGDIVQVHAKDIAADAGKASQAAGTGLLDWSTYFSLVKRCGYEGPVVLHNLTPEQVGFSRDFVRAGLTG